MYGVQVCNRDIKKYTDSVSNWLFVCLLIIPKISSSSRPPIGGADGVWVSCCGLACGSVGLMHRTKHSTRVQKVKHCDPVGLNAVAHYSTAQRVNF